MKELLGKEMKTTMYVDSMAAIDMIRNGNFSKCSWHIDIRYYHIKDKYDAGKLDIKHVSSFEKRLITKPLGTHKLNHFKKYVVS